jgi:hypothetical protein
MAVYEIMLFDCRLLVDFQFLEFLAIFILVAFYQFLIFALVIFLLVRHQELA